MAAASLVPPVRRGPLVSVEGISGVGKTFLTDRLPDVLAARADRPIVELEGFSQRVSAQTPSVGHEILRALFAEADGDPFLRSGHPRSETLLLLAVKLHDYESCLPHLLRGCLVLEGRSLHSTAVYQSLILHPDDPNRAHAEALRILRDAGDWRPLPDLMILITDDVPAALRRAEQRDRRRYTDDERRLHALAADAFQRLADADLARCRTIDRRRLNPADAREQIAAWIAGLPRWLPDRLRFPVPTA